MNVARLSLRITALACLARLVLSPAYGESLLPADREIHEVIDHYVGIQLDEAGVTAAPLADDGNLMRRTMLDLVGRIPSTHEVQSFIATNSADKRSELIDRLMSTPAFVEHQANEFNTMLMFGQKGDLRDYLNTAIGENRSWDTMFREMIVGQPDDKEQKSAIQFVKTRVSDLDELATDASSIFFGINVSCAKCHDHPLVADWTQNHFYGMKSFFSRTFDNGGLIGERDYGGVSYKTPEGESHDAQLMFLTGLVVEEPAWKELDDKQKKEEKKQLEEWKKKKLPPAAPKFSRRATLADVALSDGQDHFFARSIVNQMFYRFLGRGLVMPIDQMHPENLPSHPYLLDWLARDLKTHNYDLQRLIRGIVASDAYARSSRWEGDQAPAEDLFAVAIVRPLSPYQYATTLRMASSDPVALANDAKPADIEKQIDGIRSRARGFAGQIEQPGPDFQVSITEALLFSNNSRIENEFLRSSGDTLVGRLTEIEDPREIVDTAFWNIFSRAPEDQEAEAAVAYVKNRGERKLAACQQLVWAMLTSSECRFNY